MTDPTDPTEHRVRDALTARADEVDPPPPDVADLHEAIDRDARRRRRLAVAMGAAAAAIVLVIVAAVAVLPDDPDQVDTVSPGVTTSVPGEPAPTDPPTEATPTTPTTQLPTTTPTTGATTAPTVPSTTVAPPTLPGATTEAKSGPGVGPVPALMTDLRVGANDGFDRVVLEFADGAVPTYTVSYIDPPITQDASGETVSVAGTAYLQIRMSGAEAHRFDGEVVVSTYTGPTRIRPGTSEVVEVVNTGEFEAVYTWVIGVAHRSPFRVSTLGDPGRLVVDIAHAR